VNNLVYSSGNAQKDVSGMKAVIVSDLHIGSRYFRAQHFETLLKSLPQGYDLVLNGDVANEIAGSSDLGDQQVLELIRQESFRRKVIWIRGNKDHNFEFSEPGKISFKRIHTIGDRLLVTHGDIFDKIRPKIRFFFELLDHVRRMWEKLGGKQLSRPQFARKLEALYRPYRKTIMQNAVRYAKEHGFEVVVCGHTHYPEDRIVDGIRYINTGGWTEQPSFYLIVNHEEISLKIAAAPNQL